MTDAADAAWLTAGTGMPPALSWGFSADAPLIALRVAREGGRTLVADAGGGLYRLDPAGRIEHLQRGSKTSRRWRARTPARRRRRRSGRMCSAGSSRT